MLVLLLHVLNDIAIVARAECCSYFETCYMLLLLRYVQHALLLWYTLYAVAIAVAIVVRAEL
jgi:hypothetical protein